jgi:hypothetical protein
MREYARRHVAVVALLLCAICAAPRAGAHALAPSLFALEEKSPGEVEVLWQTPLQTTAQGALRSRIPADCQPAGDTEVARDERRRSERLRLRCGRTSLVGVTLHVDGLDRSGTNVLVRVGLADGRRLQAVLSLAQPSWTVPARAAPTEVALRFFGLGMEHLATGLDHVLFVTGLVCLLRGGRRLLGAVTAFTAGHSVTLALATLGVVQVPSGPIEVGIAASLVLLATELVRARADGVPGILSRAPWVMAFGFGLLHGLGFAGALHEAGLPAGDVPLALAGFNLGIEAAQLLLVGALLAAARALGAAPARWLHLAPRLAAEAIGVLGVYFCLDRLAGIVGL